VTAGNRVQPPSAQPVIFSDEYYRRVIAEFGYSNFDLRRFDFELAGLKQDELNTRYLCHHQAHRFVACSRNRRIVTTGFGMSGPPHMATVSHIMKMTRLQEGGERCQIVLGDLDAYNGRARPYGLTRELAERYRIFATRLGFSQEHGILRSQADHDDVTRTMYLLGRYTEEGDFAAAEEDNHGYYAAHGIVDLTMTFRRRLSLTLMAADFIALGQNHDAVLVLLGLDEHRYVRFAQRLAARLDADTPLRGDLLLAAIYARINTGFNGHPKFSKSIPGSGISVETSPDEIVSLVRGDESRAPEESPVFQLMCQMTYCAGEELVRHYWSCQENSAAWRKAKTQFADFLIGVAALWPR
jgi:tryptophanyl-tRNA synthetase